MRILYLDVDTLRPDHLGCYGYHRNTSPNIDRLAAEGLLLTNCYVSDAPCMPSRAALMTGCCGIRNGIVNHGGAGADLYIEPGRRDFNMMHDHLVMRFRRAGYHTVSVSPFAERHSAFWFTNGFNEVYNTGKGGGERADEIAPVALDWLRRHGREDDWFLHVNFWDPHTPYRTPESFGNPFSGDPPPDWMTEEVRLGTWNTYGPGCAQEPGGAYTELYYGRYPRMTDQIDSLGAWRKWIDGYDTGIRYADEHVGSILDLLASLGVLDDTMIVMTSDHGENLGELSVYGDHQTADHICCRVPFILRMPNGRAEVRDGLYYQFDAFASVLEAAGGQAPETWDAVPMKPALGVRAGELDSGARPYLVASNCAWSCQRSARWDRYMLIRSYHTGFKNYPDAMLFDLVTDPHELHDLAPERPDLVGRGLEIMERWTADEMTRSNSGTDPLSTVLTERGPYHARYSSSEYEKYVQRLIDTGRAEFAGRLVARADATWNQGR